MNHYEPYITHIYSPSFSLINQPFAGGSPLPMTIWKKTPMDELRKIKLAVQVRHRISMTVARFFFMGGYGQVTLLWWFGSLGNQSFMQFDSYKIWMKQFVFCFIYSRFYWCINVSGGVWMECFLNELEISRHDISDMLEITRRGGLNGGFLEGFQWARNI